MSKKKKAKKSHGFRNFLIFLVLIIIIASGIFAALVYENGGGLRGVLLTLIGSNAKDLSELDTIYILLMGVSTDIDTQLTDTIILCGYNPSTNQAAMLSIPRDTFVGSNKYSAKASQKINCLYAKGAESTVSAVESITGIDIDYYVVVKTDALVEIVDLIGGVEFDVPIDMEYDDPTQDLHISLQAGLQTLNGEQAEMLVRFRHNNDGTTYSDEYGGNDYGRMRTQREFIKAAISQTLKLKNILKVNLISKTIFNNIETDMELSDILPYLPYAVDIDVDNIIAEQLPGESEYQNGVWIYVHDKTETASLVSEITSTLEGIE